MAVLRDFTRAPQVDTVSSPGVGVVAVSLQLPPRLDAPVRKGNGRLGSGIPVLSTYHC